MNQNAKKYAENDVNLMMSVGISILHFVRKCSTFEALMPEDVKINKNYKHPEAYFYYDNSHKCK